MKNSLAKLTPLLAVVALASTAVAQDTPKLISEPDVSVQNEVQHAIDRGLGWLETKQNTNGSWSSDDHPALTAMALVAIRGKSGRLDEKPPESPAVKKGYTYLLSCVQGDGGIYRGGLASYNTAIVLMALVIGHPPEYESTIARARQFLIGLQIGDSDAVATNRAAVGGFGYGIPKDKRPDLASTLQVLEALHYTKRPADAKSAPSAGDLNWQAAIHFVQSCQNLPAYNTEIWASDDPQNRGGFVYLPGRSNAGQTNLPSGRVALRSYGSMSYAGLLSYIYADLKLDDPRVIAALDWLRDNFTLDENPGMGPQGLYYYYFLMAKALTLSNVDVLETKDGRKINWRQQLAFKIINLQKADGFWLNDNGRWWEKDPVLDTAYGLLTLEMIEKKI
jgi:squalene-hopene/tetraprenyl-beta-curcumene cyclase